MNNCAKMILGGVAAMLIAQSALAGGTLYTVRESDDVLVKIDLDTLTLTDIGPLNTAFSFGGLTWDPNSSTMYCVAGRNNNSLYTLDIGTGNATLVGSHGIIDMFGIAIDPSTGTLYSTQFSQGSSLYLLDPTNGSATLIGNMGRGMGGLCFNDQTQQLIGSNDGAGDLYEINRSNATITLLFDGPFVNDSGLAYDPERNYLWGIDWNGVLFYYDISSGYARTDVLTGLGAHDGLAWIGQVGYRLRITGQCPGTVNVAWSGATPNRTQGIVFGDNLGTFTIPQNQPCGGTTLGIQGNVRLVRTLGTGNGTGSVNGNAGTAACNRYLQLVEGGSCNTSNTAQIP